MFSRKARSRLEQRGWSARSLLLFFVDSWRESTEGMRSHRAHVRSIVRFAAGFVALVVAALAATFGGPTRAFLAVALATLLGAGLLTGWLLLYVHLLRRPDGTPAPAVGLANYLTLARFYLIPPLVVLLLQREYTQALVVYILLGLTDIADGMAARWRQERTEFGVVMDPLADVFSTAAVFAVFTAQQIVPGWLFAILMVRYVMLILGAFVFFLVVGPIEFRATIPGKVVGVLQGAGIVAIVIGVTTGGAWLERAAPLLYPFLGLCFASIVVSQAVIGVRQRRRVTHLRNRTVDVGS